MKKESWQERYKQKFANYGMDDGVDSYDFEASALYALIKQFIAEERDDVIRQFATGEFIQSDIAKEFEKQIKQEIIKKIEKLKDVRITEKQLQHLPNLKGIRCAGFSQCKKLIINKLT